MSESIDKLTETLSGGGLSSLLQNPEIAAKLPRIMEALAPVMAEMRAEQEGGVQSEIDEDGAKSYGKEESFERKADGSGSAAEGGNGFAAPEGDALKAMALLSGKGGQRGRHDPKRMALLRALSPYLSKDRQNTLDYVIKVYTLIDLLSDVIT